MLVTSICTAVFQLRHNWFSFMHSSILGLYENKMGHSAVVCNKLPAIAQVNSLF
jgi:hypothetical protein